MAEAQKRISILDRLAPLVMGGAGFSYQLHADPHSLPIVKTIETALDLGIRAFDTSPYYEPSEQLMGAAFQHPDIASRYKREDLVLMTKVGRIKENLFNYSPEWVRESVRRSLDRFGTSYLDVVFCHDIEFVSKAEAVQAVGILFEFAQTGAIQHVGISGYDIDVLVDVANEVRNTYNRPVDVVQNWAQLTLQNTRLEQYGFAAFRDLGVKAVCCSSPLATGLLRDGGVPVGALGNQHPAPPGLREQAQIAADLVARRGDKLSSLALRFALARAHANSGSGLVVTTITGISMLDEAQENVQTAKQVLEIHQQASADRGQTADVLSSSSSGTPPLFLYNHVDQDIIARDAPLCEEVRSILGPWLDYDFSKRARAEPKHPSSASATTK